MDSANSHRICLYGFNYIVDKGSVQPFNSQLSCIHNLKELDVTISRIPFLTVKIDIYIIGDCEYSSGKLPHRWFRHFSSIDEAEDFVKHGRLDVFNFD